MRELQNRIAFGIVAGCIGLAAAVVTIAFLALALFLSLASLMAPEWAALATAGVVVLTAALLVFILRLAIRPRRVREAPRDAAAGNPGDIAMELGNLFGQRARGFATQHKGATILGSLALGFMIGVSPGLRDLLRRGL